jgi:hypothetical protein
LKIQTPFWEVFVCLVRRIRDTFTVSGTPSSVEKPGPPTPTFTFEMLEASAVAYAMT